ncbi:MAG: hypothetical protein KDI55_20550, partial [Anaerolineae bacterium]|nr:hypothetical protein [Anaerolineae bacterium]
TPKLDFGLVPQGQHPVRKLQLPRTKLVGKVAPRQTWLQVSPDNLMGKHEIEVMVDTTRLPLGRSIRATPHWAADYWWRLNPYVRRYWWALLIGLFIPYVNIAVIAPFAILVLLAMVQALTWLTFLHASRLVQEPSQHAGQIEIQTIGGVEIVDVEIEVMPDPIENRWRWIASGGLVAAELLAVLFLLSSLV